MAEKLGLYPPKTNFFKQMEAFFNYDEDVTVRYDHENSEIKVLVRGTSKADALTKLLVPEKTFGNETVKVTVIPANEEDTPESLLRDALANNLIVNDIVKCEDFSKLFGSVHVVFCKEVAQYENDDISDLNGVHSTLYQYLAEKIFKEQPGVFYNTDILE